MLAPNGSLFQHPSRRSSGTMAPRPSTVQALKQRPAGSRGDDSIKIGR